MRDGHEEVGAFLCKSHRAKLVYIGPEETGGIYILSLSAVMN